ncbi:MAG: 50S ribosomal protein L10 [Clostridia bacterium]|nr:50S ribosomal protein L10 [Clostridia bacterium]
MTTNQEAKKAIIDEIKANIQNAKSIVLVDYRGISVAEDTTLRKELRENNVVYKVYKNRLFQKACEELGINGFESYLEGTTAFAFGMEDETAAPRLIKKQIKALNKLEIKAGYCNSEVVDAKQVEVLANIPSKEQLIANLLGMLNAPVSALARALQAIADKQ